MSPENRRPARQRRPDRQTIHRQFRTTGALAQAWRGRLADLDPLGLRYLLLIEAVVLAVLLAVAR